MGFIEKIKLLFKVKKPIGDVIDAAQQAKKTKKWFHFIVTLVATLASTAAALTGVIPPQAQLIVTTILQAVYNIIRGADKADDVAVKGTFRTSEFWLTALTESQKAIVYMHDGGVTSPWLEQLTASINFLSLAFGQNLAARSPQK